MCLRARISRFFIKGWICHCVCVFVCVCVCVCARARACVFRRHQYSIYLMHNTRSQSLHSVWVFYCLFSVMWQQISVWYEQYNTTHSDKILVHVMTLNHPPPHPAHTPSSLLVTRHKLASDHHKSYKQRRTLQTTALHGAMYSGLIWIFNKVVHNPRNETYGLNAVLVQFLLSTTGTVCHRTDIRSRIWNRQQ